MKNTKLFATATLVALASLLQPVLAANGPPAPAHKRYVGIDVGGSRARGEFSGGFFSPEPRSDTTETSTGFAIRFGYQFNRYLAAEIGYADFGDFTFTFNPDDCSLPADSCDASMNTSIHGPLINVVGLVPLSDRWTVKGRAGFFHADVSSRLNGNTAPQAPERVSEDNNGLHFGAGVSYRVNDNLDVEVAWTYFEQLDLGLNLNGAAVVFTQGSSSLASLGIAYRF
jgi:opacity protein-like surface antigen